MSTPRSTNDTKLDRLSGLSMAMTDSVVSPAMTATAGGRRVPAATLRLFWPPPKPTGESRFIKFAGIRAF